MDGAHQTPEPRSRAAAWVVASAFALVSLLTIVWAPSGCQSPPGSIRAQRLPMPPSPLSVPGAAPQAGGGSNGLAEAPPRPLPPTVEPLVRVRVGTVRAGEAVTVSSPVGALRVHEVESEEAPRTIGAQVIVAAESAGWSLSAPGGAGRTTLPHLRPLEVECASRGAERGVVEWNGVRWPGSLRLVARTEQGTVDVVAVVPLETYLPGVLAKELYRTWDLETFRAQAVAARSYAICEAAHWKGKRHFDLVAGEASQAWVGETKDSKSLRAVADTRGQVLTFEGRVVPAYYSSCCGGAAADAAASISRNPWHDIAPLSAGRTPAGRRTHCCEAAPTHDWEQRLSAAEVGRRLASWGRENGRPDLGAMNAVASIQVLEVNAAGRPVRFRVTDAAGAGADLPAEDLRYAMNASFEGDPSAKGRLRSSFVEVDVAGGEALFHGHGHGHGVGLCQFGAEAMARSGQRWPDILARYYPGATVVRAW